jgi:hypothetical protein
MASEPVSVNGALKTFWGALHRSGTDWDARCRALWRASEMSCMTGLVMELGGRCRLQGDVAIVIRIAPTRRRIPRSITEGWVGVVRFAIDAGGQDPAVRVEPIRGGIAYLNGHVPSRRIGVRRRAIATCCDDGGSDRKCHDARSKPAVDHCWPKRPHGAISNSVAKDE